MNQKKSSLLTRREFLRCSALLAGAAFLSTLRSVVPAPIQKRTQDSPTVIFIVADALRADHVSAYGYSTPTTPNLDKWVAAHGARFTQATSPAPWTYPASAAMMTGRSPTQLTANWETRTLPMDVTTLAEYLHFSGYYTAGFASTSFLGGEYGFARGFDIYDDWVAHNHKTSTSGGAAVINDHVFTWFKNTWNGLTQPLFLFLYYSDPHSWYYPPTPYDTLYDPNYIGELTPESYGNGQAAMAGTKVPVVRDLQHLLSLYDGEITFWDYHIGQMFTFLQQQGLLEHALIVVTSDHGELFGENGMWVHGNCLYEEVLRIPLLLRYSGVVPAGSVVDTPAQNMDIMPTILDFLDITYSPEIQGVSLAPVLEEQISPTISSSRSTYSELDKVTDPQHWAYAIAPRTDLRCIQRDGWKLIHHVDHPEDDELYFLNSESVYETENLIHENPALAQELRQLLWDWFQLPSTASSPYTTERVLPEAKLGQFQALQRSPNPRPSPETGNFWRGWFSGRPHTKLRAKGGSSVPR